VIVKPDIPSARPLERCTSIGMGTTRLTAAARARAAAIPILL
jgi:TPP-dependent trihydroxycyclohexane-1,2-dione (THcHDO) dehydratase